MSLKTLSGNDRNKRVIRRLLRGGAPQLGRTFIFAGPAGIGKRQFAIAMAKAANCLSLTPGQLAEDQPDSCDQCPTCRRIDAGAYGDVTLLLPEGQSIRIAQTRAVNDEVFRPPREGRQRFFIIDDAERLRDEAANSLLKTLEEPPPTSTIVLITSQPDSLLPTIRSRAQRLNFTPLALPEMLQLLGASYPRPAEENDLLARIAGGSLGRALTIDLSVYRQERRILIELLDLLADSNQRYRILKAAEFISKKERAEFDESLVAIEALLRDLILLAAGGNPAEITNADLADRLKDLALRVGLDRLILWAERFAGLRHQQRVNVNRQLATEALLLSLQLDRSREGPGRADSRPTPAL